MELIKPKSGYLMLVYPKIKRHICIDESYRKHNKTIAELSRNSKKMATTSANSSVLKKEVMLPVLSVMRESAYTRRRIVEGLWVCGKKQKKRAA